MKSNTCHGGGGDIIRRSSKWRCALQTIAGVMKQTTCFRDGKTNLCCNFQSHAVRWNGKDAEQGTMSCSAADAHSSSLVSSFRYPCVSCEISLLQACPFLELGKNAHRTKGELLAQPMARVGLWALMHLTALIACNCAQETCKDANSVGPSPTDETAAI